MTTSQERNMEKVKELLDAAFNKKKPEIAAKYVKEEYIQHNPQVPTGKVGLVAALPMFYQAHLYLISNLSIFLSMVGTESVLLNVPSKSM